MTVTKVEKKTTRTARAKGAKVGREEKELYFKLKAFALEKEKKNYSKLFVIHERENWWKMVGNSAIIFHYEIAKRIRMSSKLVPDSDFDYKSEDGVVNIRNIDILETKLEHNGVNPLDIKPEYRVFNLGKKYTPSEIANLKKQKELELARVNKMIMPEEIHPVLFMTLRDLLHTFYFATKDIEPYARKNIVDAMLERVVGLVRNYSLATNSKKAMDEYLAGLDAELDFLNSQMIAVSELRLQPIDRVYRVLRSIEKVRREATSCKKRRT